MKKQFVACMTLMFFVSHLISVETPADKFFRKQMYENKVVLPAEDKNRAAQIISDHIKKCQKKLKNGQSFSEKVIGPILFLNGLVAIVGGIYSVKLDTAFTFIGMVSFYTAYFAETRRRESVQKLTHYLERDHKALEALNSL